MSNDLDLIMIVHHMTPSSHHHTVFIPSSHQNGSISCDLKYGRNVGCIGLNNTHFSWIMKSYCQITGVLISWFSSFMMPTWMFYWWSRPGLVSIVDSRCRWKTPWINLDTWQDSSWRMHFKEDLTGFVFQAPMKKAQPYQSQKPGQKGWTVVFVSGGFVSKSEIKSRTQSSQKPPTICTTFSESLPTFRCINVCKGGDPIRWQHGGQ